MKNEITNTGKPVPQNDEQASVDKASSSTTQNNAELVRRRNLLKGLGAAPLVITLHSGAAMAAKSNLSCLGEGFKGDTNARGCVAENDGDDFLRVKVGRSGQAEGYSWGTNGQHPYYDNRENEKNLCLVSVDANGIMTNEVTPTQVPTTSCWASFM